MTEGNPAMQFLNHLHSLFPPFNEHPKLYVTGLGSHFAFLPTLRSLTTTALKGGADDVLHAKHHGRNAGAAMLSVPLGLEGLKLVFFLQFKELDIEHTLQ